VERFFQKKIKWQRDKKNRPLYQIHYPRRIDSKRPITRKGDYTFKKGGKWQKDEHWRNPSHEVKKLKEFDWGGGAISSPQKPESPVCASASHTNRLQLGGNFQPSTAGTVPQVRQEKDSKDQRQGRGDLLLGRKALRSQETEGGGGNITTIIDLPRGEGSWGSICNEKDLKLRCYHLALPGQVPTVKGREMRKIL